MARQVSLGETRNIGIMAHIDAGKTTTTERILYYTGRVAQHGRGRTTAPRPWTTWSRSRSAASPSPRPPRPAPGATTGSTSSTPPGTSTSPSRSSAACACSTAPSRVFCAVGGVEPQSETVWRQADKYRVPRIAFVNKMDRTGADFERVLADDPRAPRRAPGRPAVPDRRRGALRGRRRPDAHARARLGRGDASAPSGARRTVPAGARRSAAPRCASGWSRRPASTTTR